MNQIIETVIILLAVAIATAWLARRFLFKEKRGCGDSAACSCSKPDLPKHLKSKE